jgi:phosphotriesterase-related protein
MPDYHLSLARIGCYVCFDSIGTGTSYDLGRAVDYVIALVRAGFSSQVLLSHDVFLRGHLRADGGPGYGYLLTDFLPLLIEAGLDAEEAQSFVTTNPRHALTGAAIASEG